MLHIILAGLLAFGVIKLIEKVQQRNDHVSTGAIVASTVVLGIAINIAVNLFELPQWYLLVALPVYYVFPLVILKKMWELSWRRSHAYAGVICGSILLVEFGLYFLIEYTRY
jgi:hypothetical protein